MKKKTVSRGRNGGRRPSYAYVEYTEEQKQLIKKAEHRKGESFAPRYPMSVQFTESGNFTKCVIVGKDRVCFGVAKRNPTDPSNHQTGQDLAFYRAVVEQPVKLG